MNTLIFFLKNYITKISIVIFTVKKICAIKKNIKFNTRSFKIRLNKI